MCPTEFFSNHLRSAGGAPDLTKKRILAAAELVFSRASFKLTADDLAEIDAVSKPSKIYPEWVFDLRGDRIPGGSRNYSDLMKSTV